MGGPPLTAEQQRQVDAKEAAVAKWVASGSAYSLSALKHGVNTDHVNVITPDCVTDPYTGNCAQWIVVSVGGQYTQEPAQEVNWCGPGAATAVALHWISSTVNNHAAFGVRADNGSYYWLYNAQAWMGDFAQAYYVDGQYGVQPWPSTASYTNIMRDAMNSSMGTGGYYVTVGADKIVYESDLYGNATYDISHDGHPMIFLVDASYLQEWPYQDNSVNHYVMGYAYGFWSDHNVSATNKIYYADTASPNDYGTAGDYSSTYDYFWQHPWKGQPRNTQEKPHTTPQVIIV